MEHQLDEGDIARLPVWIRLLHNIVLHIELIQRRRQVIDIPAQAVGGLLLIGLIDCLVKAAEGQGQIRLALADGRNDRPRLCIGIGGGIFA